jgi:hypothetical protein
MCSSRCNVLVGIVVAVAVAGANSSESDSLGALMVVGLIGLAAGVMWPLLALVAAVTLGIAISGRAVAALARRVALIRRKAIR